MGQLYFLISSLPSLKLNEPAPALVTSEWFLDACSQWLSEREREVLDQLSLSPPSESAFEGAPAVAREWVAWEVCLRNRLARGRGSAAAIEAEPYIRPEPDYFAEIERVSQDALAAPDPLQREIILDNARWRELENLECGHLFDFAWLCVYRLKLLLLEKIFARDTARGEETLSQTLDALYQAKRPAAAP